MDAEEWLAGYRTRLAELEARSGRVQDALARAGATATSPDGAVAVTVDPAGGLRELVLSDRTSQMTRTQLAAAIVATAAAARHDAAVEAVAVMAPLLGEGSRAMDLLRGHLTAGPPRASGGGS